MGSNFFFFFLLMRQRWRRHQEGEVWPSPFDFDFFMKRGALRREEGGGWIFQRGANREGGGREEEEMFDILTISYGPNASGFGLYVSFA